MRLKQSFLFTILIFTGLHGITQDPHFSQYFSSPLTLNPAVTGSFEGSSRIAINYRSQSAGIGNLFTTATVSFDTKILKKYLKENDKLGIGILGMYDKSVNGLLNSTYLSVSAAYHKTLDEDGYQSIGAGFQGTLGNRRLDYNKITFGNQFNSDGFDLSIPSGESIKNTNILYLDFNIGGLYNYSDENKTLYIGASYYHIPRPKQSFLADDNYRLNGRYSIHGGASFELNETGRLFFSGLYMKQGTATDKVLGMSYAYFFPDEATDISVMAGSWYRFSDAIYPYAGIKWNGIQVGLSYDINTSSYTVSNSKNKSFEVSCIYIFKDNTALKKLIPWY